MNTVVTLPSGHVHSVPVEVLQHIADLRQQNAMLRKGASLEEIEPKKPVSTMSSPKVQAVPVEQPDSVFAPNPAKSIARTPPIRFGVKPAK